MKRAIVVLLTVLVVFVAVFAVLVLRPVQKVKATPYCGQTQLNGPYAWTETGTEFEVPFAHPPSSWTEAGLVEFDGTSTVTSSNLYYIENGVASGPGSATGSYTVAGTFPACTVTITYTWENETYTDHGVIVFEGVDTVDEVVAVEHSNKKDTTGTVRIKRISPAT
jgi:hypothetical protein